MFKIITPITLAVLAVSASKTKEESIDIIRRLNGEDYNNNNYGPGYGASQGGRGDGDDLVRIDNGRGGARYPPIIDSGKPDLEKFDDALLVQAQDGNPGDGAPGLWVFGPRVFDDSNPFSMSSRYGGYGYENDYYKPYYYPRYRNKYDDGLDKPKDDYYYKPNYGGDYYKPNERDDNKLALASSLSRWGNPGFGANEGGKLIEDINSKNPDKLALASRWRPSYPYPYGANEGGYPSIDDMNSENPDRYDIDQTKADFITFDNDDDRLGLYKPKHDYWSNERDDNKLALASSFHFIPYAANEGGKPIEDINSPYRPYQPYLENQGGKPKDNYFYQRNYGGYGANEGGVTDNSSSEEHHNEEANKDDD